MKRFLLVLLATVVASGGAQATTVLLDDTFTEASRTAAPNLPTSTPWYASSGTLSLTGSPHTLQLGTNSQLMIGYFNPVSLSVGDSVTLSFTFQLAGTVVGSASAIRLGLFNSGGTYTTADNLGLSNGTVYNNYTGYGALIDPSGANATSTAKRGLQTGTSALVTSGTFGGFGSTAAQNALSTGTPYTATLTITRNASNATVAFSLNGTTVSNTDVTNYSTFDTVTFFGSMGSGTTATFSEIQVTTTAVPEPRAAALAGAAGIALLALAAGRARRVRAA